MMNRRGCIIASICLQLLAVAFIPRVAEALLVTSQRSTTRDKSTIMTISSKPTQKLLSRRTRLSLGGLLVPMSATNRDDDLDVTITSLEGRDSLVLGEADGRSVPHFTAPARKVASIAGLLSPTFLVSTALALADVGDDVELAELPPPYVPAIFGLGLLVGVGWLTSSLGNVMDEEASLGLQSGARAKKEMERSRSSFFKKR